MELLSDTGPETLKMLDILTNCEKCQWSKARRLLIWLMVFSLLMGVLIFYYSNPELLFSPRHWAYKFYNSTNIMKDTNDDISVSDTGGEVKVTSSHQMDTSRYFVAYPHQYHFIVDEEEKCRQQNPFLVLMIPVAPQNREARDVIRKTWGTESKVLDQVISHFFFLGQAPNGDGTTVTQEQVIQESQKHHDLIQGDFVDSYNNLTIKTMVMLEWLTSRCEKTSYAMKIDSDVFLNVRKLVEMLGNAPRTAYMTGLVAQSPEVLRDPASKWFMPIEVFPDSHYPTYVLGLGYVFSLDLAKNILEASKFVKAVYIEDVYLGLCMKFIGISPVNPPANNLFMAWRPTWSTSCYWAQVITTLLDSPQHLLEVWQDYQSKAQSDC